MTKARDTANIVGGGFSGTIAGATMEPTGDTAAGDNAAMGFTSAEGLILTGQGSTNDVTIKNDADADVIEIPTGTVNVTMAGTLGVTGVITGGGVTVGNAVLSEAELEILDGATVTTGELNLIDGGTARGTTAIADGDGVLVNDAGTMRMTNVTTLATYMGTKIGGGTEFISSSDASGSATLSFTGFDASKFDNYVFKMANLLPATDNQWLRIRLSIDSGSNYLAASDSYTFYTTANVATGDNSYLGFGYSGAGNAAGEGLVGEISINSPHLNVPTFVYHNGGLIVGTNGVLEPSPGGSGSGSGKTKVATVVNAVQFSFLSGNIASGTITMYGMVNS